MIHTRALEIGLDSMLLLASVGHSLLALTGLGLGQLRGLDLVVVLMFAFVGLAMLTSLVLGLVLISYSLVRAARLAFSLVTSAQSRTETRESLKRTLSRRHSATANRSGSKVE